jgi:hypothetical protein
MYVPIPIGDAGLLSQSPEDLPTKGGPSFEGIQLVICMLLWSVPLLYRYAIESRTVERSWISEKLSMGAYWFFNGFFLLYPVLLENGLSVFQGVLMALQLIFPVTVLGIVVDRLPAVLSVDIGNTKMYQAINIAIRLVFVWLTVLLLAVPLGRQLGYAVVLGARGSVPSIFVEVLFDTGVILFLLRILYLYLAAVYWLYYQSPFFKILWSRPSNLTFQVRPLFQLHSHGRDVDPLCNFLFRSGLVEMIRFCPRYLS